MPPLFIKAGSCLQSLECFTLSYDHVFIHSCFCFCLFLSPHLTPLPPLFILSFSICRIMFSTPLAVLSYFLIWYVPPFENGKVIWYLFFYCLFQSLQTVSMTHTQTHKYCINLPKIEKLCFVGFPSPFSSFSLALVLPCAILCPHHVHQLGAEREGLSHCIQWVSYESPGGKKDVVCV